MLRAAGIFPVAFEVAPRALARAALQSQSAESVLFVHIMDRKTGMYIVSRGIVSFTSTLAAPSPVPGEDILQARTSSIAKEAGRIQSYWTSKNSGNTLGNVILVGQGAGQYEGPLSAALSGVGMHVRIADVWQNAFDLNKYVPAISRDDSLEYAVAAGLGLPS
jgi:hypothetical protein